VDVDERTTVVVVWNMLKFVMSTMVKGRTSFCSVPSQVLSMLNPRTVTTAGVLAGSSNVVAESSPSYESQSSSCREEVEILSSKSSSACHSRQ
jgi:hypothetical protein